jgi:DNA invertase Pin-like site-specific DNA recombinase
MKRAVLYLRVSTLDQATANQERELREIAGRIGCDIVKVYKDHGVSGAKGRDKRPAFDALCRDATKRQFEMVMAWSVDRLGRSLQDLVGFLSELHALRIDLFLHKQGIDTTTPAGKAMFQMMGVFAEFERTMIQERVRAGLARARSEGKRLGRPPIAPMWKMRSERPWTSLDEPRACARSRRGLALIRGRFRGSAALSCKPQAPPRESTAQNYAGESLARLILNVRIGLRADADSTIGCIGGCSRHVPIPDLSRCSNVRE